MKPRWLDEAYKLLGVTEIKGAENSPEILKLWEDAGLPFTDDETAWCAGFVGACLKRGGAAPSGSGLARSYLGWGFDVTELGIKSIPPGAVLVYSRPGAPGSGHVGFAMGITPEGHIMTLGGNQGDKVSIKPFAQERLLAARWPMEGKNELALLRNLPKMKSNGALSEGEA